MASATRTDALLSGFVLAGFLLAFFLVDARFSAPFFLLGAAATVCFELLAARDTKRVRRVWERPAVQALSLLAAVGIILSGSVIAPSRVLSAGIGALVAYGCLLALVSLGVVGPPETW